MTGFAICPSGERKTPNEVQDAIIKVFGCMTNAAAVIAAIKKCVCKEKQNDSKNLLQQLIFMKNTTIRAKRPQSFPANRTKIPEAGR